MCPPRRQEGTSQLGKKMHRNGFVEGTFIAYAAIIIAKLLGALYSIPFYNLIGDKGGVIYSCAYNVYSLFLSISTSGIPVAISIVISEYRAMERYQSEKRAYRLAFRFIFVVAVLSFLALQVFAEQISRFFLSDMTEGVRREDITLGIRTISFCILVVPFLSLKRGYLQGHKFLAASSASQVVEQIVRIIIVLVGAYVSIVWLKLGVTVGVCVALFGAAVGAIAALGYLQLQCRRSRSLFVYGESKEDMPASNGEIIKKVFSYCVTLVIVAIASGIYDIVDMKMLLTGLHAIGYPDETAQVTASIASTWVPKICMIITALSMGLTTSIAPHMAESHTTGKMGDVNGKLNQAILTFLTVSIPLGTGMILLAEPIFRLFYGASDYGASILQLSVVVNIIGSLATVVSMSMQSIGKGKAVCVYTVLGIALNAGLDLPLIYLFDFLHLPAYLGASAASIIGYSVTTLALLLSLKHSERFRYRALLRLLPRILLCTAAMAGVVLALRAAWPVVEGRNVLLVAQLCVYALCGGGVYLLLALPTKLIEGVLGKDLTARISNRLRRKK